MREFVVGGLAAMTATSFTHPVDLLKVRMLLYGEQQAGSVARLSLALEVVRREGFRGMYRGLSAGLMRQALYSTTRFGFYDIAKRALGETRTHPLPYYRKVMATMTGGSCAAAVACPADMMLVRMQADGRLPPAQRRNYRNVLHGLYRVAREEGIPAWYRGLGPLVVRGVLVTTAQFSTYDQVKETLIKQYGLKDTISTHFYSSLFAGVIAATVSTPCDVIKSRMMNSTQEGQHGNPGVKYTSSWHCLKATLRVEGVRGLYKGFLPTYMRMGPQVIIMWAAIEQYRKLWDKFIGIP